MVQAIEFTLGVLVVIGGGTKKTQNKDIKKAHMLWAEYKKIAKQ